MPKFVFEIPYNWKCNQCPYCQDPEGGGFCECQFEVLHGDERSGKELGLVNTDMPHPHWCPLAPEGELELAFCVSDSCDCCEEYVESCNGAFRYKEFIAEE